MCKTNELSKDLGNAVRIACRAIAATIAIMKNSDLVLQSVTT